MEVMDSRVGRISEKSRLPRKMPRTWGGGRVKDHRSKRQKGNKKMCV